MRRRVTLGLELTLFRQQLHQWLEQVVPVASPQTGLTPPMDLAATDGEFIVRVDLPGVEKASLRVQLTGKELQISGEKPVPRPGSRRYHQVERRYGSFILEVVLPGEVCGTGHRASFQAGVLEVRLQRQEARPPESVMIPIETEEP